MRLNYVLTVLTSRPLNLLEQRVRCKAHGEMYMPKHLYRMRGSSKPNRHILEKFKKLRAAKVLKLDLPQLDSYYREKMQEENADEFYRTTLKLHGLEPARPTTHQTKYFLAASNTIIDPYTPPENDGSFVRMAGDDLTDAVKAKSLDLLDKGKNVALRRWQSALKKIRAAEPDFDAKTFGERALNIFVDAHDALQRRDELRIHDLVTELAFPKMWYELEQKTLRWQYVQSIEPPTVVHLRQAGADKENIFAQVTVRFHSQQKLAIYDQFGRLYLGNEAVARDVLEYVVFENYISSEYGTWRIHGKIASRKSTPLPAVYRTYAKKEKDDSVQKKFKYSLTIDEKSIDGDEKAERNVT